MGLPAMRADLGASPAQLQLVIAGYGIGFSVFLVTGGRLGDIFGRKRMFLCLDHVLVLSERHLRHILTRYFAYYHRTRTHLSLTKEAPDGRLVELPKLGQVVPILEVGGLHHRYVRRAACCSSPGRRVA